MPAITPSKLRAMSDADDPKQAIWDAIGRKNLAKIEVLGSRLLVGTYIPKGKSAGGIIFADKTLDEGLWQGSLGLVLKKGESCFKDDDMHKFYGADVEVDQWVLFRYSSGWEQHFNGASVRFLPDTEVIAVVADPELITSRPSAALGG